MPPQAEILGCLRELLTLYQQAIVFWTPDRVLTYSSDCEVVEPVTGVPGFPFGTWHHTRKKDFCDWLVSLFVFHWRFQEKIPPARKRLLATGLLQDRESWLTVRAVPAELLVWRNEELFVHPGFRLPVQPGATFLCGPWNNDDRWAIGFTGVDATALDTVIREIEAAILRLEIETLGGHVKPDATNPPPAPEQATGNAGSTLPPTRTTRGGIMADRAFPQLPSACYDFLMYLDSLPPQLRGFGVCAQDMPPGVWNQDVAQLCIHHDLLDILKSCPETKRLPVGTPIFSISAKGAACLAEHRLLDNSSSKATAKPDQSEKDDGGVAAPIPVRDRVFISYSHRDRRWLDDLLIHLKPYLRDESVTAWSDQQIVPGSKWFTDIQAAITATKVAVLLVTPDFLASDFIHEHELGPLLKEAEAGGVRIIWVPVRSCSYRRTSLKDYQAVTDPESPLAGIKLKADRDTEWVRVCEEIEKAVRC